MKIKSALLTQVSGSLGGLTGSHNKGGMYFRARSIPVNPASSFQTVVRNALADLVSRWADTLTTAQRSAWATYADNVLITDTLGEPRAVTALNMYLRSNVIALQNGLTPADDAPTVYNLGGPGDFDDVSSTIDAGADTIDLAFWTTDDWANETGAHMIVAISRPVAQTINFFKGPFRNVGKIAGDGSTPPTSPQTFNLPFAVAAGQRIFVQTRVRRADGRLTLPFRIGLDVS